MPAFEINRSVLVNQGLSARAPLPGAVLTIDETVPAVTDILGSFKELVGLDDDRSVVERGVVDVIAAFTTPLDLATYFINAKYAELGGATGVLGTTVTAVSVTANGAGYVRTFQRGAIYWHPQLGAHELHGPIRVRWQELGGETGFLGFPTGDVTAGTDVRSDGLFAHFQGGSIYWAPLLPRANVLDAAVSDTLRGSSVTVAITPAASTLPIASAPFGNGQDFAKLKLPMTETVRVVTTDSVKISAGTSSAGSLTDARSATGLITEIGAGVLKERLETSAGAFEVHGMIREKYLAIGAEASILGYPRSDETGTPDGIGRYNHFQSGSIYWTPGTAAHEVHGLIRDRWAGLGWERNPQLGYPITDELIPDPRIGHRRPEVRKKPIVSLPSDVIKLPADAAAAGFPLSVVNTPRLTVATEAPAVTPIARPSAPLLSSRVGAIGKLSEKSVAAIVPALSTTPLEGSVTARLDPITIGAAVSRAAASTPAESRSVNRFADFENGVLFWYRGATSATTLSPLSTTGDGTLLSFSGADVAAAALLKIGKSTFESQNAQLTSMTFAGTTGYSFDGAQVHNRRHRLHLILHGSETQTLHGPLGIEIPQVLPVTATIDLQVELSFDPSQRRIALVPIEWTLIQASSGSYADAVSLALRAKLDPLLWTSYEFMTLPDTDGGAPIAVLSVKTLPNGTVGIFVEPHHSLVLGSISELANAVTPSVVLFTPRI